MIARHDTMVPPIPLNDRQKRLMKRSTARLATDLAAARRSACECDSYHGFTCSKHDRIRDLEAVLGARKGAGIDASRVTRRHWVGVVSKHRT